MNIHCQTDLPALLCLAALGLFPAPALAALGQAPNRFLNCATPECAPAKEGLAQSGLFRVCETLLPTGTLVKEYAGLDGRVFAVSWRGPVPPDWSTLLGPYFFALKEGRDAALTPGKRGSPLSLSKDGLVVQASGRSPHFFGYAYVTHLVPPGINVKDVVQ